MKQDRNLENLKEPKTNAFRCLCDKEKKMISHTSGGRDEGSNAIPNPPLISIHDRTDQDQRHGGRS